MDKLMCNCLRILFFLLFLSNNVFAEENLPLHLLKLPANFSIKIFANHVEGARSMTLGDQGTVFVGSKDAGNVYAVVQDEKHPNKSKVIIIAKNLKKPNGVTFYQGDLYVAEQNRILRFKQIESHLMDPPKPIIVSTKLPNKDHHGWRYIKIGPDHKIYIGIGAPCNVCLSDDVRFATIARMNRDGSDFEIFAHGVRNTVGFDWDPVTKQLWFTDNSRDLMDDETPPEELNHAVKAGLNFGFPYCHAKNISDPKYGKEFPCSAFMPPVFEMPAHVAPLGMTFYTGKMFPGKYFHQIFIAEHGSWNRSSKIGYQVVSVKLDHDRVIEAKPFVTGWLQNEEAWGRPVDVLMLRDGSLLISDDYANVIYRVTYHSI
jgi:glucose/arabinose dehydrogenase